MNRTQIYISDEEQRLLKRLSKLTGKTRSSLIRDAIDRYLNNGEEDRWRERIEAAAGIWRNRKDLPDFRQIRATLDRQ